MESRSIVHTRMLRHRVGIVNIEFDSIDMHVALRRPNTPHVAALQRSLSDDCSARWAQPIDVVVGPHVSLAWLDNLRDIRIGTATPLGSRFICIGGQHRLLAGRRFVEEWMAEHENESVPPQLSSWPATVYEQAVLNDSELEVWMTERNLARTSLHVTLYERLVMIDNVSEVEAQKRALGLLGWNSRDAASILSIRNSAVWEPLLNLVQWPLLAAMASGTVVDWSVEYHAYPILAILLEDVLEQQEELRIMKKDDEGITMDYIFGPNSAQNQHISKSGIYKTIHNIWGSDKRAVANEFNVETFDRFWHQATHRTNKTVGREIGSRFLFGRMIVTPQDLNFHSVLSPFSERLRRTEVVASMMHVLLHYPTLVPFLSRRPKTTGKEFDWVEVLDPRARRTLSRPKRAKGEKLLIYLLHHVRGLLPDATDPKQALRHNDYPHMKAISDKGTLGGVLQATISSEWQEAIEYADTLGMHLAAGILELRSKFYHDQSSEEEKFVREGRTVEKGRARPEEQEDEENEQQVTEASTSHASRTKRKRATKSGLMLTIKASDGTIIDEQVVRKRKKPRVIVTSDDSREEAPTREEAPDPVDAATPETEQELDEEGNVWKKYRLGNSRHTAKYVRSGGMAYIDSNYLVVSHEPHAGKENL